MFKLSSLMESISNQASSNMADWMMFQIEKLRGIEV
jgi:hypothetical protein